MEECSKLLSDTKYNYLNNLGNKLNDPFLGPKKYWSILNTFLNKKKITLIPPILHNDTFVTDMKETADIFNICFSLQCSPFRNSSTLPNFKYRTERRLRLFEINQRIILNIINSLNVNKSHGWG